jgi:hypothetical protein
LGLKCVVVFLQEVNLATIIALALTKDDALAADSVEEEDALPGARAPLQYHRRVLIIG